MLSDYAIQYQNLEGIIGTAWVSYASSLTKVWLAEEKQK